MTEFSFELSSPIEYQRDGQNLDGKKLRLIAPSYKQKTNCQELKQLFYKAVKPIIEEEEKQKKIELEVAKKHSPESARKLLADRKKEEEDQTEDKKKDLKAGQFMPLFLQSDLNIDHLTSTFERLLLSGICTIDGIPVTKSMLQDISLSDSEKLFGEYMFHFLA